MVDLRGKDKGNISLPERLHPPDISDEDLDEEAFKVLIINMQKALYNVRITEIQKRIKRLESRNIEVLDGCETTVIFHSHTEVETQDAIAQLNRQLFVETEKIDECKKRVDIIEKWRSEEKQAHLKKVEMINDRYVKTHLSYTSEVKALNAKINTLEDYKNTRHSLRDKLKAGDDLLARREEEIKKKLEQIERKFKIDREKLKNEMYKRLLGLAGTFQTEVAGCVAKPIHRLMRENIVMKNEITQIVKESLVKKNRNSKKLGTLIQYQAGIKDGHMGSVNRLITVKIQGHLVKTVREEHASMKKRLAAQRVPGNRLDLAEALSHRRKEEASQSMTHVARLETLLHRVRTKLSFAKLLRKKTAAEANRCMDRLYDAKYAVTCALKMNDTGEDALDMGDTQLLSYLLDILLKGDTQKWTTAIASEESVPDAKEAYKIGDLGFEPKTIDVEAVKAVSKKEPSELSTFAILRELGTGEDKKGWEFAITGGEEEIKGEESSEESKTDEGDEIGQEEEVNEEEEEEEAEEGDVPSDDGGETKTDEIDELEDEDKDVEENGESLHSAQLAQQE